MDLETFQKLINWSEMSRFVIKTKDRNGIRSNHIPKKHLDTLEKIFTEDFPLFWDAHKAYVLDEMRKKKEAQKLKEQPHNGVTE